ncbi:hypothetical protein CLU82_0570 [Flavobacterium sp. 5]|nr:hypothetical protein CLU82_0570 [Flavobacterium sp. 5]
MTPYFYNLMILIDTIQGILDRREDFLKAFVYIVVNQIARI